MKKITLQPNDRYVAAPPCNRRLLLLWGCYGIAMGWLWRLGGSSDWWHGAAWAVAILLGFALLLRVGEL